MTREKRVLVAGGAGFLGSHLCERLLAKGCRVFCLDNFQTGRLENISHLLVHRDFMLLKHDIIDPLEVRVDEIYNLACPASPVHYQGDPLRTLKTSVYGAVNLLDLVVHPRGIPMVAPSIRARDEALETAEGTRVATAQPTCE